MAAGILALTGHRVWRVDRSGSTELAVAERDALGTTARIVVWPADALPAAVGTVDRELSRLDLAASRFRSDSELSGVHRRAGGPVRVSTSLAEAIWVALASARWTNGLVDPTVGTALIALGYDRDFAEVRRRRWDVAAPDHLEVPGWQAVKLDGTLLDLPAGVRLDLGATAKGLGADWAAQAVHRTGTTGGALVSLGGDLAVAGESPAGGWPVLIADDHRQLPRSPAARAAAPDASATQVVRLASGGIATSSITCRQWQRAGQLLHHIVDPRTGRPASGPWRTASVAAATGADANAAATAAIIGGDEAPKWLTSHGLPARLVRHDGSIVLVSGWPVADGGLLPSPPPSQVGTTWNSQFESRSAS